MLDPTLIIGGLATTVTTLAALYAALLRNRISVLEKERDAERGDREACEKLNQTYVSLFLQLKEGEAGVTDKVLKKVAYLLRGGPDIDVEE